MQHPGSPPPSQAATIGAGLQSSHAIAASSSSPTPQITRLRSASTLSRRNSSNQLADAGSAVGPPQQLSSSPAGVRGISPMPSGFHTAAAAAAAVASATSGTMAPSIHPPLEDLEEVDQYVLEDSSNLIHVLPAIASFLEQACIANHEACRQIWAALHPLLRDLLDAQRAQRQGQGNGRDLARPASPVCTPKPYSFVNVHGEEWQDDYAWLNDRENPDVLSYIEAENKYSEQMLADTKPLQKVLYKEFLSRLDDREESARAVLADGWEYYSKKVPGQEYMVHCRIKDGVEEAYLDENELANSKEFEDASFFRVGFLKHSPDGRIVAYGIDSSGNERYTANFIILDTKEVLPDRIEGVYEDFEFSNDGSCVYYTLLDEFERAYQLLRHRIGTSVSEDPVLYHEQDEMFYLALTKTCNGEFIILNSSAQVTSETRYISANDSDDEPHLLFTRKEGIQYTCENHEGYFYILTNEDAKNNWLYRIPVPSSANKSYQPTPEELIEQREAVIEHRDFVLIEDFQIRKNHLIVFERSNCLQNVRIIDMRVPGFSSYHYVSFSEVVYSLLPGSLNGEVADMTKTSQYATNILRFTYTSFVQPKQVIDYDMDERTMTVVQEEKVPGLFPYDQSMYSSRRLFATGVDGTAVPISIVFRRDLLGMNMTPAQTNPVLLHSYGAYGSPANPIFSSSRLSLLDRGFIYAIAHIRGGADMGKGWYEEGKLAKKPNTFYDFCSVAEFLIKEGYTEPSKLAIYGRSAGGLLIGAVVTLRPELFAAALTEVPFVDVINTMFDSTIPWTAFEYEEWGNPNDREIYDVMKTYCPYTNVDGKLLAQGVYPHLLVVGGMNDPRVAFFEPLKWVAKMRGQRRHYRELLVKENANGDGSGENGNKSMTGDAHMRSSPLESSEPQIKTRVASSLSGDSSGGLGNGEDLTLSGSSHSARMFHEKMLLLRIDDAGHGGNSGQYSHLDDLAFEYAFLIKALGASTKPFFTGGFNMPTGYETILSPLSLYSDAANGGAGSATAGSALSVSASNRGEMMLAQGTWTQSRRRSGSRFLGDGHRGRDRVTFEVDEDDRDSQPSGMQTKYGWNGRRRRAKDDEVDKSYRNKSKGDRGQSRLFQWINNWF